MHNSKESLWQCRLLNSHGIFLHSKIAKFALKVISKHVEVTMSTSWRIVDQPVRRWLECILGPLRPTNKVDASPSSTST
uniref:Uncharacterized protein n=1 Tax=Parascaris equorum TaxID=6256 RepID=A0A914RY77_PAREQ